MAEQRVTIAVPATQHGPAIARQLVAARLSQWGLAELSWSAELIVSELVTNAVQHASGPDGYELQLQCRPRAVLISVADHSPSPPAVCEPDDAAPAGRGLRIVATLPTGWGSERDTGGKRVWAELAKPSR